MELFDTNLMYNQILWKYFLNLAIVLVYVTDGVEIISFFIEKNKHDRLFRSFLDIQKQNKPIAGK